MFMIIHLVSSEEDNSFRETTRRIDKVFFFLSEQGIAAEAVKIHKFKISPCSVKSIRNLVKKFEETGCTCGKTAIWTIPCSC